MARHWKRLVILLVAYAGAICAAFSGWFGGRAIQEVTMRDGGPSAEFADPAGALFLGAVALGFGFAAIVWHLVPPHGGDGAR